jgi:hypothetical protein
MERHWHQVLGATHENTIETLRAKYRQLQLESHPDKQRARLGRAPTAEERAHTTAKFREVRQAYAAARANQFRMPAHRPYTPPPEERHVHRESSPPSDLLFDPRNVRGTFRPGRRFKTPEEQAEAMFEYHTRSKAREQHEAKTRAAAAAAFIRASAVADIRARTRSQAKRTPAVQVTRGKVGKVKKAGAHRRVDRMDID